MKGTSMETRRQGIGFAFFASVPRFLLVSLPSCLLVLLCAFSRAADWPQWRGPDRNDVSKETGLLKTWPNEGPPLLWTFENTGIGYSGPAIVGDRLFIMGARDDDELVIALDTKTGAEVWSSKIGS